MSIRPVDIQTLIPKLPEVQKAKNVESETAKNNFNINLHKEQQQHEKDTKQVTETKKSLGKRIDRERQEKEKRGKQQEKEQKKELAEEENNKGKKTKEEPGRRRIDIRI